MSYERSACPPEPSGLGVFFISCDSAGVCCGVKELRRNSVVLPKFGLLRSLPKFGKILTKNIFRNFKKCLDFYVFVEYNKRERG